MIKALRRYAKKYNHLKRFLDTHYMLRCKCRLDYGVGLDFDWAIRDYKKSYNETMAMYKDRENYDTMTNLLSKLAKVRNSVYFSRK